MVNVKTYGAPPLNLNEIARYTGSHELSDAAVADMLSLCEKELSYKVCYIELPLKISDGLCDFGLFSVISHDLAKNLRECDRVLLFTATIGVGIDRLITKYSRLSPSRAVMLDAFGSERIEALCDAFCEDVKGLHNVALVPRFSPGYGDLPLETQRSIISVLNTPKNIGVSLTDSLLLTPTKSVTAFVGIKKG